MKIKEVDLKVGGWKKRKKRGGQSWNKSRSRVEVVQVDVDDAKASDSGVSCLWAVSDYLTPYAHRSPTGINHPGVILPRFQRFLYCGIIVLSCYYYLMDPAYFSLYLVALFQQKQK